MKHYFIVNPVAGKTNHLYELRDKVEKYFEGKDMEYSIIPSEYHGHCIKIVSEIAERNEPTRIYSCGGDGTLNECVRGAFGHDNIEIACYPCGTGNDFIKAFGDKKTHKYLDIENLVNAKCRVIDLIKCNDMIGINNVNIGFDAAITKRAVFYKKFFSGNLAYTIAMLHSFFSKTSFKFKVETDDGYNEEKSFTFCCIGNGTTYGGGFLASPNANTEDGLLDVTTVSKISRPVMLSLIDKYKYGRHELIKQLKSSRATKIHISSSSPVMAAIDGELFESDNIDIDIIKHALKFAVVS